MKASTTTIQLAKVMGQEAKAAGLASICQNSDLLFMLNKFNKSAKEIISSYTAGYKA